MATLGQASYYPDLLERDPDGTALEQSINRELYNFLWQAVQGGTAKHLV